MPIFGNIIARTSTNVHKHRQTDKYGELGIAKSSSSDLKMMNVRNIKGNEKQSQV